MTRYIFDAQDDGAFASVDGQLRLFLLRQNHIESRRALTPAEAERFRSGSTHLRQFGRGDELLLSCDKNYEELGAALLHAHKLTKSDNRDDTTRHLSTMDLNRRLINYLGTFRLYVDFNLFRTRRHYGKRSTEAIALDALCKNLFDNSFSYRFGWKLRNYSQHFGPPIGHIRGSSSIDDAGGVSHRMEVYFDTRKLLEVGGDLWGPVRRDLQAGPEFLDVPPVIDDLHAILREMRTGMRRTEEPSLRTSTREVLQILRDPATTGGRLRVGHWTVSEGRRAMEFLDPPFWTMRELGFIPKLPGVKEASEAKAPSEYASDGGRPRRLPQGGR